MKKKLSVLLLVLVSLALVACGGDKKSTDEGSKSTDEKVVTQDQTKATQDEQKKDGEAIVSVNGKPITKGYFDKVFALMKFNYVNSMGEEQFNAVESTLKEQIKQNLIDEAIIEQNAKDLKLEVNEEELSEIYGQVQKNMQSNKEMKSFFDENKIDETFIKSSLRSQLLNQSLFKKLQEQADTTEYWESLKDEVLEVRASHILVEKKEEAEAILKEIEGGADFNALAKKKSTDPLAKENSGDLGYFTKAIYRTVGLSSMVKEFEEAAFTANVGEVTGPVKTQFGYHLIKIEDVRTLNQIKEDKEAKERYPKYQDLLKRKRANELFSELMDELRKKAKVSE